MSESPASRMAIVEQRKSLPQAVPSSICTRRKTTAQVSSNCVHPPEKTGLSFAGLKRPIPLLWLASSEERSCLCGARTYVGAAVVVDGSLGQHGVVLELGLAERRGVASDKDQLGLARAEG